MVRPSVLVNSAEDFLLLALGGSPFQADPVDPINMTWPWAVRWQSGGRGTAWRMWLKAVNRMSTDIMALRRRYQKWHATHNLKDLPLLPPAWPPTPWTPANMDRLRDWVEQHAEGVHPASRWGPEDLAAKSLSATGLH